MVKYRSRLVLGTIFLALNLSVLALPVHAQDNYEIQVYSSEATPKNVTMVEIHSNFTVDGSKQMINGVLPTITPSTKLSRSRKVGRTGSRLAFMCLRAFRTATVGTGWEITFARASRLRSRGTCRWE